jgi:NADPH2:quinone reductase
MRAVMLDRLGGPETLGLSDLPRPEPGIGEVLVRVTLAGVNPADVQQRETGRNHLGPAVNPPFVPGGEIVGVRADTGERVAAICGLGGYAEWAVARADRCLPIPDGIPDAVALCLTVQGLTAFHLLRTPFAIARGASIAIHGAGSGVGMLAVQLARAFGAGKVIATARAAEDRARALDLGADAAIAEDGPDLAEAIVEANDGRGVDLALEMIGGRVFEAALRALGRFGRLIVYGAASGEGGTVAARSLIPGSRSVSGFWLLDCIGDAAALRSDFASLTALVLAGKLWTPPEHAFGLADAAAAHEAVKRRSIRGKLVLDPAR